VLVGAFSLSEESLSCCSYSEILTYSTLMELLNFNLQDGRPMKGGTWSFSTSLRNRSEA